jgi:signal transduction histidine kinase
MSNTIDEFRAFIKPSSIKVPFDIHEATQALLRVVEHSVKYNYITMSVEVSAGENFIAYGYPNEFKQCVLNIINNAKDSILKKRETNPNAGHIKLFLASSEEAICLSIDDDGQGIEEGQLETIFEPFISTKPTGDGFGLYMARLIIEDKMQGSISAHHNENGGATLRICIPKGERI